MRQEASCMVIMNIALFFNPEMKTDSPRVKVSPSILFIQTNEMQITLLLHILKN